MEHVSEEPHMDEEDHVEKFLAFQAYTKPHYLSLAFTEEDRIDNPDISDEDLRAFVAAAWAMIDEEEGLEQEAPAPPPESRVARALLPAGSWAPPS